MKLGQNGFEDMPSSSFGVVVSLNITRIHYDCVHGPQYLAISTIVQKIHSFILTILTDSGPTKSTRSLPDRTHQDFKPFR